MGGANIPRGWKLGGVAQKRAGREPKTCLGRVLNFKLDRFVVVKNVLGAQART
jgi:hypothetical protein